MAKVPTILLETLELPEAEVDTGISKYEEALTEDCPDIEQTPSFSIDPEGETVLFTACIVAAAYIALAPALTLEFPAIVLEATQVLTAVKEVAELQLIAVAPNFSNVPAAETEEFAELEATSLASTTAVGDTELFTALIDATAYVPTSLELTEELADIEVLPPISTTAVIDVEAGPASIEAPGRAAEVAVTEAVPDILAAKRDSVTEDAEIVAVAFTEDEPVYVSPEDAATGSEEIGASLIALKPSMALPHSNI